MDDFNLHLTGDIHAITAANNLLAAQIGTGNHKALELQLKIKYWPELKSQIAAPAPIYIYYRLKEILQKKS
jgi:formyltetrahydrofolate synthetase